MSEIHKIPLLIKEIPTPDLKEHLHAIAEDLDDRAINVPPTHLRAAAETFIDHGLEEFRNVSNELESRKSGDKISAIPLEIEEMSTPVLEDHLYTITQELMMLHAKAPSHHLTEPEKTIRRDGLEAIGTISTELTLREHERE